MKKSHERAAPGGPGDENRQWMEEHVLGDGDLLVYGRLAQELDEIPVPERWAELRKAAEAYLADGPGGTEGVHRRVDEAIEALVARDRRFGYAEPFCHRGFCQCCHEVVYCTSLEARRIHDHCRDKDLPIDYARLERQLDHVETDEHLDHTGATTWSDQPEEDQACAFLDPRDGSCTIWAVRPLVCRVHLAEGSSDACRPHNGRENPEARGISYIELSYILTAVFTLHRDSIRRTLGRLLLELKEGSRI